MGGLIVGIENRDGNTNIKFHQKDTLERIFGRLESEARVLVRKFRADCGSRRTEFMEHEDWDNTEKAIIEYYNKRGASATARTTTSDGRTCRSPSLRKTLCS